MSYNIMQQRKNQTLAGKEALWRKKKMGWWSLCGGEGKCSWELGEGSMREFMRERRKFVYVVNNMSLLKIRRLRIIKK